MLGLVVTAKGMKYAKSAYFLSIGVTAQTVKLRLDETLWVQGQFIVLPGECAEQMGASDDTGLERRAPNFPS